MEPNEKGDMAISHIQAPNPKPQTTNVERRTPTASTANGYIAFRTGPIRTVAAPSSSSRSSQLMMECKKIACLKRFVAYTVNNNNMSSPQLYLNLFSTIVFLSENLFILNLWNNIGI